MMNKLNYTQGVLFKDFDSYIVKPCADKAHDEDIRLRVIRGNISPYIIGNYEREGDLYLPKADSVNITLPNRLITFEEAKTSSDRSAGIHHFLYDDRICAVWNNPLPYIKRYQKFNCTLSVDFSVYMEEDMIPVSLMSIIKNRYLTCAFQKYGIKTIPVFTFGHPSTEKYWYDGIPESSQVAMCNIATGRTESQKELRRYAIEGLVRYKHPSTLIVYGSPLDFEPDVEVRFYEGKLYKLKHKNHEKN